MDVSDLFIGSERALGVITAAALKLFPLPRLISTAFVGIDSVEHAMATLSLMRERFVQRYLNDRQLSFTTSHPRYVLLKVCSSTHQTDAEDAFLAGLGNAPEHGYASDAVLATNVQQDAEF